MAKENEIQTLRELMRDLEKKITTVCINTTRIEETLNGDFGIATRLKESDVQVKLLKTDHYKLANEYRSDKAKVYGFSAAIALIFGSISSLIKYLITK